MLVRRLARPMFAAWFVVEGLGAVRHPEEHVDRASATWDRAAHRLSLPPAPHRRRITTLVRGHGVVMVGAAAMLATGRAPRTAALLLAGLTLPLVVVHQPLTSPTPGSGHRVRDGRADVERVLGAERFWRSVSMLGGAVLAGIDHEGRPGVAWRVGHARVDRAALRQAKAAASAVRPHR